LKMSWMNLELTYYPVEQIIWSDKTYIDGTCLYVDREELRDMILADNRFSDAKIEVAYPGESTRIIHVIDVIEPRYKSEGGSIFPGFLGPGLTVGSGKTSCLSGMTIMNCSEIKTEDFLEGPGTVLGPRERIIDMSGPAAPLSPFSTTVNLVINYKAAPGVSLEEYDQSIRLNGLKVAAHLAQTSTAQASWKAEHFALTPPSEALPKVALIYQLQSHGYLRDTYLYGETMRFIEPTLIHPNELFDGAVVGASMSFCATNTYTHCNNRVVTELYKRHGKDLNFVGIVLTSYHHLTDSHKQKRAHMAAKLAKFLGAEGMIITQEGGGNSIIDQMVTCKFCEELGIKVVGVTYEMAGKDGRDYPLIYHTPEADALVSTGNREEIVHLPKMERVLGGDNILFSQSPANLEMEVYFSDIAYSTDLTGFSRVRAWQY